MFVGHYGVSFAAKRIDRSIPLWVLFLAVQLLDVVWAPLILLGVEKVRIVPGLTATNPLDLYYMPYTHSLVAALVWSVVGALAYQLLAHPASTRSSIIVGAAVFSHWVLDFIVHTRDLPLYDNHAKVGLGLWNAPMFALALESLLLLGGIWWCFRENLSRAKGTFVFGVLMVALQTYIFFGPPPASDKAFAWTAIAGYVVLALVIWWLQDRHPSEARSATTP
ncbi:MAG TPA: hypothetical protein VGO46_17440 [Gemmatimonadaceae bacterium]|nr:hypothetical protein [Gemmatimonadaceae bacterium]